MENKKTCQHCEAPIKGRSDKKFCDDYCRNSYNNERLRVRTNTMRNIEYALRRNRKILERIWENTKGKSHRDVLLSNGFNFMYMTHMNDKQPCIYDFSYSLEKNGEVVVKRLKANPFR